MSERAKYVKGTKSALLFIGIAIACVLVLFAIGSAEMSNPNTKYEVTDSHIFQDDGEWNLIVEVTTIREHPEDSYPFRSDVEPSENSWWIGLGTYDTREDAEQELDEFKERIESGGSPW